MTESTQKVDFIADRCDRCNASGKVEITREGLSLVFCGHHYRKDEVTLTLDGWTIKTDARDW